MNCKEAAECVSALFDSHQIPREVAAHLADCHECRVRLNEYAEMGAELRDLSSAATTQAIPEGRWKLAEPAAANHWVMKWRGTMRIPRFAFALMLIAIFALSGGLALVRARPGGNGSWLLLTFKVPPTGQIMHLSTKTDHEAEIGGFGVLGLPGHIWTSVRFVRREGQRVELSIKTVYHDPGLREPNGETADEALKDIPAQDYWLDPDKPLGVQVAGLGAMEVSGEFLAAPETATANWFGYEVLGRDGKMIQRGAVPPNGEGNSYYDAGAGMTYPDGMVCFQVHMLARVGEAERIGVRALWVPKGDNRGFCMGLENNLRVFLYSPGEQLKIPVEGYGNVEIKGQFSPTLPETVHRGMYPEYGKFRIDPPVLLVQGRDVLGRFVSGGGELPLSTSYFAYGQQDEGWYLFSTKPIEGAVEGTLTMNDIEFTLDGKQYSLFTGDPIVFGKVNIWVKHYASIKDADPTSSGDGWQGNEPRLAFGELQNLTTEK